MDRARLGAMFTSISHPETQQKPIWQKGRGILEIATVLTSNTLEATTELEHHRDFPI